MRTDEPKPDDNTEPGERTISTVRLTYVKETKTFSGTAQDVNLKRWPQKLNVESHKTKQVLVFNLSGVDDPGTPNEVAYYFDSSCGINLILSKGD